MEEVKVNPKLVCSHCYSCVESRNFNCISNGFGGYLCLAGDDEFECPNALLFDGDNLDTEPDMVHRPPHYTDGQHEAIETISKIIESSGLSGVEGYLLGSVLKYALRAGKKDDYRQDCAKAGNYAHRLVTGDWA